MKLKLLPMIALLLFAAAPVVIGSAEQSKKEETAKEAPKEGHKEASAEGKSSDGKTTDAKTDSKSDAKKDSAKEVATTEGEQKPAKKLSSECLASEEVIADLEAREKKLKQREETLKERENEVTAQAASVKEEMAKLEQKRADIQGVHEKEMASREEQVNKLIETFEGMSPKAAAAVIAGVDEELAVMSLGKLTSVKAGKILANLKPEKSSRLSELMAYGKTKNIGKEAAHGESDRSPASNTSKR